MTVATTLGALAATAVLLAAAGACDADGARPQRAGSAMPWRVLGVTIDDPWNTEPTVKALAALPRRPTSRVVLDLGPSPRSYAGPVAAIHRVSDVMAEILDSYYVADVSVEEYAERTEAFLDALGSEVDVWEIGNEVNGEWTGDSADVARKIELAHRAVKARGGKTALTLYYNRGCEPTPDREVFRWAAAHVPAALRAQIDQAWLSWYEEDCPGVHPDWPSELRRLAELFPSATVGIGECGAHDDALKLEVLERCYAIRSDHPRFAGGGFWWHFSEDMVPASKPLWGALARIAGGEPRAAARERGDTAPR